MNKTYPLITQMVDWSLDVKKNHFCPQEEYKEIYGLEIPYISAIDTLMYFAKLYLIKSTVNGKCRHMISF
jgi:hypothetical protein